MRDMDDYHLALDRAYKAGGLGKDGHWNEGFLQGLKDNGLELLPCKKPAEFPPVLDLRPSLNNPMCLAYQAPWPVDGETVQYPKLSWVILIGREHTDPVAQSPETQP